MSWQKLEHAIYERLIEKGIVSTLVGILFLITSLVLAVAKYEVLQWGTLSSVGLILLGIKDNILRLNK